MSDPDERSGRGGADSAGRRIGPLEVGKPGFDHGIASAQRVVLRVGNRWPVFLVVAPIMLGDLRSEPCELAPSSRRCQALNAADALGTAAAGLT